MKKIAIIGGGIAGLSAGIYAQLNGFESVILEKNSNIGGECIGWKREGCYIDGCIHWLTGSNSGELNSIWKRVGALENVAIIEPDYLYCYIDGNTQIKVYRNIDKFKAELLNVSAEDGAQVNEFIEYVKSMEKMTMPTEPIDQMSLAELMKLGKSMSKLGKTLKATSNVSIGEYAQKFKSEKLRKFMLSYMPAEYQLMSLIVSIATFTSGNGNIPSISSMDFSEHMKDKYLSLGGKVRLNTGVTDMIMEGDKAQSIVTHSGEKILFDYVVPACDADVTYHSILKNKYNDKKFEKRYRDDKTNPLLANCYFAYSIDKDAARNLPHSVVLESEGISACGKVKTRIALKVYDYFDNGNGLVTAISPLMQDGEDYSYWQGLYQNDKTKYNAEKIRIGEEIKNRFVLQSPELKDKIKLIDSATPLTYNRYVGAYKGAYMAFMLTKNSKQLMHNGKIKGIKNCFSAGQWLMTPGGLPSAVVTGKFAIQRICKAEKKAFVK